MLDQPLVIMTSNGSMEVSHWCPLLSITHGPGGTRTRLKVKDAHGSPYVILHRGQILLGGGSKAQFGLSDASWQRKGPGIHLWDAQPEGPSSLFGDTTPQPASFPFFHRKAVFPAGGAGCAVTASDPRNPLPFRARSLDFADLSFFWRGNEEEMPYRKGTANQGAPPGLCFSWKTPSFRLSLPAFPSASWEKSGFGARDSAKGRSRVMGEGMLFPHPSPASGPACLWPIPPRCRVMVMRSDT